MNVRHPAREDFPDVLALLQAADEADLSTESDWTEAALREHWADVDLETDAWLVEVAGRLAGYADFENPGTGRMLADGYVHPDLRGLGVGSQLLRLTEERAQTTAATIETGRIYIQNATIAPAEPLYRGHGYSPVRRFRRMVAELDVEPVASAPRGVTVRSLRLEEARAVHELLEEAFAEHWEHRVRTFEEFERRTFSREGFDATLSFVAEDGGALVGASLNHWKTEGEWGWIGTIGVRPASRGRGIGEALARRTFAEFFRRGERRVALGVDVQNETGALRLYERLGMRTFWEAVVYEKELRPGD